MSPTAYVQSLKALQDLKIGLTRFAEETGQTLQATDLEIKKTEIWLDERHTYWKTEVIRFEEDLRIANAALERCRSSGYRDTNTGLVNTPPCIAEQKAVEYAQNRLTKAKNELSNVHYWKKNIAHATDNYQQRAQQLKLHITSEIPKAEIFLQNKISELQAYLQIIYSKGSPTTLPKTSSKLSWNKSSAGGVTNWPLNFQLVSVDQIDVSDSPVKDYDDFIKVSAKEMEEGLKRLKDVVIPAMAQGADGDYFYNLDISLGQDPVHGYKNIYDVFFGTSCITLDKAGGQLKVINGYHRLFVAQQIGIKSLPVRIL